MIECKRLKDCTIEEGVKAWNVGFEGYYFDATTTPDKFINRLAAEGLSTELSIVAFKDEEPVGIVKSGVRQFNGKKIAWNGGTGVASSVRKQGIGRLMMMETLQVYREEGVDIATLEAISSNERAIALYKKLGYEIIDDLVHLELKGSLPQKETESDKGYTIEKVAPQLIGTLSFYKGMSPWQTQWQAAKDGHAIIIKDVEGVEVGYAYYKQSFDSEGKHIGTTLFQCEAKPNQEDAEKIIDCMLNHIFDHFREDIRRVIPNLPKNKSHLTYKALERLGFKEIANQVFMIKNCE